MLDLTVKKGWVALLVSFALLSYCGTKDQKALTDGSNPVARLTITKGDVKIVDGQTVTDASAGVVITAGQFIRTGADAMAEIFVKDQGIVRLSENTEFGLKRIDAGGTELDQKKGTATVFLKRLKQNSEFTVNTPTSVAAVRGTSFMINVKNKSESRFALYDGSIEVSNSKGQSVVMDGRGELSVTEKGDITRDAIRPLSRESLDTLKKMAVFQKSQIEEYNSFIDDLKETETMRLTREEGDVNERLAGMRDRPSAQDNTGKASSTDENMVRRNTEKDPLKIQPQKTFK